MDLNVAVSLEYALQEPTDLLLQIEAADLTDQRVITTQTLLGPTDHSARVAGENDIGTRMWLRCDSLLTCDYTATLRIDRPDIPLASLPATPPHLLPAEAVRYMMPSSFCPSDDFQTFVATEFAGLTGGAQVAAMRDWVARHMSYVMGASGPQTTALDTFVQRRGVCRDYAHLLIAFARAAAVPARYASVYAAGVTPQDFHAVAQVYLSGAWHLIDATGMSSATDTAIIGVGLDAAETAFLNSYRPISFRRQTVSVTPA